MNKFLKILKQFLKIETCIALATLFIGGIAISFAAIFIKLSESEISPNATTFNRLWIAFVALGLWNGIKSISIKLKPTEQSEKPQIYTPQNVGMLITLGLFYVTFQCVWAWSLTQTNIAISTLLHNLTPIFISLGAWLLFRQQFDGRFWIGMVLAVGGTIGLGLKDLQMTSGELGGDFAALISAVLYGGYLLTIEQLRPNLSTNTILMWGSLIGTIVLLPILLVNQEQLFPSSPLGWLAVICLAFICHVIGQGLVIYSINQLSATFVSLFLVLNPAFTAFEAGFILSEHLSFLSWISLFISLLGVSLTFFSKSIHKQEKEPLNSI
ncbi:DMT family transporter [Spirulina sp. 06S082]|uniref:DMT family transporter n=1 Tax=Spirulina sp. 06S082 TaxID=3110248 RepID=UPI002B1E9CC9|nr:DMT family transporter [Spirulina sp. 06S082]MEA5468867.1 DMT family transporter [Spirulina sp. 06S082]